MLHKEAKYSAKQAEDSRQSLLNNTGGEAARSSMNKIEEIYKKITPLK
jgi:hypothetical protein